MPSRRFVGMLGIGLFLAGCSACSSGGGATDGGAQDGATSAPQTMVTGQITVKELNESFAYKAGDRLGGCGSSALEILLTGTKDPTKFANLEVGSDGAVKFSSGAAMAGTYTAMGATNTTKSMVSGGKLDCSGSIALSNLVVTTGASQSLTLDGKLDIVLRY